MIVVGASDLHGYLPKEMPDGQVLCLAGDTWPLDYQRDLVQSVAWFCLEFLPWADNLPYEKIILVGGNHDFLLAQLSKNYNPSEVLKKLLPGNNKAQHNIIYLCDNSVEIEGKRIYGTPWISDLSNWAFYKSHEDLANTFDRIPKKLDVLVSHMPPRFGNSGVVLQKDVFNTGANYGSQELAEAIDRRNIKWAIHGHVHSGEHNPIEQSNTMCANVSLKDENYVVNYEPLVFEI